ncbi:MAG: hypothetical protein QXQ94_10280 [Candidatus Bathyarchaeia archaeon]
MMVVEVLSWLFVYKEWDKLKRMPTMDKGFEESFREYLYEKINFDSISSSKDMGLGLAYSTLSNTPHELDVICTKDKDMEVFELKHYEVSNLTKEIVFTFLGKVLDFFFKNAELLSTYRITMYLVTINRNVDDNVRKLCLTYGIKLIEPTLMTIKVMDHYLRDLHQKIADGSELKPKVAELIENVNKLEEQCDYSFSDIFRYKDKKIIIDFPGMEIRPSEALSKIIEYYTLFEMVRKEWKSKQN